MPFNFTLFFRLTFNQFFKFRRGPLKFTPRRRIVIFLFYLIIPLQQLLTFICFYLDEIIFPAYRRQEIKAPVFIVGNFRSGSTLLQRLLAQDKQFTSMNIAEIYIAPTLTQRAMWKMLGAIDRVLFGGRGRRFIEGRDKTWLNSLQMHKVGLFTPDEDEGLLVTIWSTLFLQYVFPVMDELPPFDRFDEGLPEGQRQRIMGFYRAIIRRHLYAHGGKQIYLAKSPGHASRIDSLVDFFPDARIIYLTRNPMRMVPSAFNFFDYAWNIFGIPDGAHRFQKVILRQLKYWYLYPLQRFKTLAPERYFILRYNDFVAEIHGSIEKIYTWMGLPLSAAFSEMVDQVVRANQAFESDNVYTLEKLGLTKQQIADEFHEVFELFKFDRQANIASAMQ
jgi:hypothetical protein